MCKGMGMLKSNAILLQTLTKKKSAITIKYAERGASGLTLPHFETTTKPSKDMNRNCKKVTKFPHPGSSLKKYNFQLKKGIFM